MAMRTIAMTEYKLEIDMKHEFIAARHKTENIAHASAIPNWVRSYLSKLAAHVLDSKREPSHSFPMHSTDRYVRVTCDYNVVTEACCYLAKRVSAIELIPCGDQPRGRNSMRKLHLIALSFSLLSQPLSLRC